LDGKKLVQPIVETRAALPALVACAEALRGVFDHRKAALRRDGVDLVHVRRLTVERDRHDRPRARRDCALEEPRIEVAGVGLDIDQHRLRPEEHDHLHGCDEGERAGDHFVARLDVERYQRDEERVGAAGANDGVLHADMGRQALLELRDLGAEDVLAVVENLLDAGVDGRFQRPVLGLEVYEIHGRLRGAITAEPIIPGVYGRDHL
jgi:hypothetical protein